MKQESAMLARYLTEHLQLRSEWNRPCVFFIFHRSGNFSLGTGTLLISLKWVFQPKPLEGGGEKMKTYKVGILAVAILLVVAGIGFGIAQAAGNHSEQPVLSFEDQEALDQGSSLNSYVESRPVISFEDQEATQVATSPADDVQLASERQEFVPEGNWSGIDWQIRGPVETGAIPGAVFEESWMKDYGND